MLSSHNSASEYTTRSSTDGLDTEKSPMTFTVSDAAGCTPGDQYQAKIPAPPLITFALPTIDASGTSRSIDLGPVRADAGAAFLAPAPAGQCIHIEPIKLGTWQYPHRREAQAILPFLFLGPASYARDVPFLERSGITKIVVIAPSQHGVFVTAAAKRSAQQLGIPCDVIIADTEADMSRVYKTVVPAINAHLTAQHLRHASDPSNTPKPGAVFLACDSGNHSSAALAAAYLMQTFHDVDHTKAMSCVNSRRMSCDFTNTIRQSLYTWHLWLEAQRNVGEASKSSASLFSDASEVRLVKHKRSFVRDEDNDDEGDGMDVDQADDAERFHGRRMTPFVEHAV